jgi:CheY-like chemotaxis protein
MKTLLLIEDNPANAKLFRIILLKNNYSLIEADDGQIGLDYAQKFLPDLILTDIQLPLMNGKDLVKRLKTETKTKDIPVIALTSFTMKGDKEECLNLGFSDYLTKPIKKDDLIHAIKTILKE